MKQSEYRVIIAIQTFDVTSVVSPKEIENINNQLFSIFLIIVYIKIHCTLVVVITQILLIISS